MDLIQKVIAILLFAFPLTLLNNLESDLTDITEDDQIALTAIESVLLVAHDDLAHYDDMDYAAVVDGHTHRKFDLFYNEVSYAAGTVSRYKQIVISDLSNNRSQADLFIDSCDKKVADLYWADRAVMKISYLDYHYALAYGESGLVREIQRTYESGKHVTYKLGYTDDEKISSIKTYMDGSLTHERNYEYTEASISMTTKNWNSNSIVSNRDVQTNYTSFIFDDYAITKIEYQTEDKTKVSNMVEYIFNGQGQLVRHVASQPGKGVTTIHGFDYNEQGQILKSSRIDVSIDSILNHSESLYAYQIDDKENNLCNQKINKIQSIYDEDGNLASMVKESSF